VGAVHPELQLEFIGHLHHSLFPPATALLPRGRGGEHTEKKKWYNLEIKAETFGFRCFTARWYQCFGSNGTLYQTEFAPKSTFFI